MCAKNNIKCRSSRFFSNKALCNANLMQTKFHAMQIQYKHNFMQCTFNIKRTNAKNYVQKRSNANRANAKG